jgi:hypothetical protein
MSIHHIQSVLWLRVRFDPLDLDSPDLYNDPYNLIVLGEDEHLDLHPESRRLDYLRRTNIVQFGKEVHELKMRVINGGKNWNDEWDDQFLTIVRERTEKLLRSKIPWPLHDTQYEIRSIRRLGM